MALSNYKSAQIELNVPNKVLATNISSVTGYAYWPHQNGSGDIWYSGSGSKKYYQWEIVFSVTEQLHGSHLTRDDFKYNGLDEKYQRIGLIGINIAPILRRFLFPYLSENLPKIGRKLTKEIV